MREVLIGLLVYSVASLLGATMNKLGYGAANVFIGWIAFALYKLLVA